MTNNRNYYDILKVNHTADKEEIKNKYDELTLEFHLDENPSLDTNMKFSHINTAYETLYDPQKRKMYDVAIESAKEQESKLDEEQESKLDEEQKSELQKRASQDKKYVADTFSFYKDYMKKHSKYRKKNPIKKKTSLITSDLLLELEKKDPPSSYINYIYEDKSVTHDNITDEQHDPSSSLYDYPIVATPHEEEERKIELERRPSTENFLIKHNVSQIKKHIDVFENVQNNIDEYFDTSLFKVFRDLDSIKWESSKYKQYQINKWYFLCDQREGADIQKDFIRMALSTPDFALLEGPPGSGKTTVLCELVKQFISQNKTILFCAPTHVAVDNLIDKLTENSTENSTENIRDIIPLRIAGDEKKITTENAKMYSRRNLEELTKCFDTAQDPEAKKIVAKTQLEKAIKSRIDLLESKTNVITVEKIADSIICGTVMGIMKYVNESVNKYKELFDVMILDEASKTTFSEFIVPAMKAKRWVISGDTKQLSPYTDEYSLVPNLENCMPDKKLQEICLDVFSASKHDNSDTVFIVVEDDGVVDADMYIKQCKKLGVRFYNTNERYDTKGHGVDAHKEGAIVMRTKSQMLDMEILSNKSKIRNCHLLGKEYTSKWKKYSLSNSDDAWAKNIAWRMQVNNKSEIGYLMPSNEFDDYNNIAEDIQKLENIPMLSILRILKDGYKGVVSQNNTLELGLPDDALEDRYVLLKYQYRMHPDIAKFSKEYVYYGKALNTPTSVATGLKWSYRRYPKRLYWIGIGESKIKMEESPEESLEESLEEANRIISEITKFIKWTIKETTKEKRKETTEEKRWDIGIIVFYSAQEEIIKEKLKYLLRTLSGITGEITENEAVFTTMEEKPTTKFVIHCGTVDSFQGREVDISFISFSKSWPTSFTNNLDRLNVAVTRARYQCVILSDQRFNNPKYENIKNLLDYAF